jgi:hypothetical protein
MLEKAVELGKANLSEDDPDVLVTAYQLGSILQQDDDPTAARRVLEEAYAAGQWRLGDSDPLMLQISHDLGVVAEELGNRHEARKAFGRVAELGPSALGAQHPAVARARAYLGQDQNRSPVRGEAPQPEVAPSLPAAAEDDDTPTAAIPRQPAAGDQPTTTFEVVSRVQPPSPENQRVWTGPDDSVHQVTRPRSPIEEPTVVQPTVPRREQRREPPPAPSREPRSEPWNEPPREPWTRPPGERWPQPPTEPSQELQRQDHWPPMPVQIQQQPIHLIPAPPPRRGVSLFAAIAAVLAAVIAVAALVFVLANRNDDSNVPTLGGNPPANVKLRDEGSRIRLTWTDPTDGTVSFMVAMAHPGEQLKPVGTLGPGQTSYEMSALNPTLDYCFAVIAVYRNNKFATSEQACTERPAPSTPN